MDAGATRYLEDFRVRGEAIAEACTGCGACFRACPMLAPAGLAEAEPEETAAGIIDLITGGAGTAAAVRWASVCSGSGNCIPACPEGINTRFMVQLARGFARAQAGEKPLNTRWRQGFQTMSSGVRILSRLHCRQRRWPGSEDNPRSSRAKPRLMSSSIPDAIS
jgi:heterodisulfide reductase subunit D